MLRETHLRGDNAAEVIKGGRESLIYCDRELFPCRIAL